MSWFKAYESVSNKNMWTKLSSGAAKRRRAALLVANEKKKKDAEEARKKLQQIDARVAYAESRKRNRTSFDPRRTASLTFADIDRRKDSTAYQDNLPPRDIRDTTPTEGGEYAQYVSSRRDIHGRGYLSIAESEAETAKGRKDSIDRGRRVLLDIDAEISRKEIQKQVRDEITLLNLDAGPDTAFRNALNPMGLISIDVFSSQKTRDFVLDVRSGNTDLIGEQLRTESNIFTAILRDTNFLWVSKYENPDTLDSLLYTDDLKDLLKGGDLSPFEFESMTQEEKEEKLAQIRKDTIGERVGFAPSLKEIMELDPLDILQQFMPEYIVVDGVKTVNPNRKVILGEEARAFFIEDEVEREVAVRSLTPEQQSDFILGWIQTQAQLIEEGRFDELVAVPFFGEILETELRRILTEALTERKVLSEEELNEVIFLSYASGFPKIEFTKEEQSILDSITEEEKEGEGGGGGIGGFIMDRAKELSITQRGQNLPDRDPRSELEREIVGQQKILRGEMPPELVEKLLSSDPSTAGVAFAIKAIIDLFDEGAKISRPIVRKWLVPILSATVPELINLVAYPIEAVFSVPSDLGLKVAPNFKGMTRDATRSIIESKIFETGLTEILNPANILFVIPFVGPGSRFVRAMQAGNKVLAATILADEFMFLGNTPAAVDGLMRLVAYTARYGLRKTLLKFPGAKKNGTFMKLMGGLDRKVIRRDVEHEITAISSYNAGIAQKNRILKLIQEGNPFSPSEIDTNLMQSVIHELNQKARESSFVLKEQGTEVAEDAISLIGRNSELFKYKYFDQKLIDTYGEDVIKTILDEGGAQIGKGFSSGRPLRDPPTISGIHIDNVSEDSLLNLKIAAEGSDNMWDNFLNDLNDTPFSRIDREDTDQWYLGKELVKSYNTENLTSREIELVEGALKNPTEKPFGSGFIREADADIEYENVVTAIIKASWKEEAETGRKFYTREIYEETSGGAIFSIFGVDDAGEAIIRGNTVGLPTDVGEFIKVLDDGLVTGDQKEFVDQIFDEGKRLIDKQESFVERGINKMVDGYIDEINELSRSSTAMSSAIGQNSRAEAHRRLIEIIAYKMSRNVKGLDNKITMNLDIAYEETANLMGGNNGLLTVAGKFYDVGDESPIIAMRKIWERSIDTPFRNITSLTKATESDVTLATVTKIMDTTGVISITRRGNDKLVIEAIRFIDHLQADAIRRLIDSEGIKEISFSFDSAFGIRSGNRQTIYRGATGSKFDEVLKNSTGVCSL